MGGSYIHRDCMHVWRVYLWAAIYTEIVCMYGGSIYGGELYTEIVCMYGLSMGGSYIHRLYACMEGLFMGGELYTQRLYACMEGLSTGGVSMGFYGTLLGGG